MGPPIILLLSGGIDSTALLDLYLKNKKILYCLHYSYGQKSEKSELEATKKITEHYKIKFENVRINFPLNYRKDEVLCRNTMFIMSAASFGINPSQIALGIHKGTDYYDCSENFIQQCQKILNGYFSGTVQIDTPFINYEKRDIINYCRKNVVPLELTYSCVRSDIPCGECNSCLQRERIYENK